MSVPTYIGTLYEDLAGVAWRIQRLPAVLTLVVWADECGNVYASEAGAAPGVEPNAFIGNYCPMRTVDAIEEDLRAALRERARGTITDVDAQAGGVPRYG